MTSTLTIPLDLAERLDSPHSSVRNAALESLRRIIAAPVVERQEPVAWVVTDMNGDSYFSYDKQTPSDKPLYTAPPAPTPSSKQDAALLIAGCLAPGRSEGPVNEVANAILELTGAPVAVVLPRYTCIGKGGEYELLGSAIGAGTLKDMSAIPVYRDTTTGQLFVRTPLDFATRMDCIDKVKEMNQ